MLDVFLRFMGSMREFFGEFSPHSFVVGRGRKAGSETFSQVANDFDYCSAKDAKVGAEERRGGFFFAAFAKTFASFAFNQGACRLGCGCATLRRRAKIRRAGRV